KPAFAAGIADADKIFYSAASGVGRPVVYLGAKTGRDGVGGATMASAELDDSIEDKRPTVQVGDPFTEKRLMEACLELMETGAVISIQDMGAAGLTCSAVEMGDKGGLGIRLDLEKVPVREDRMTAYEMMLSESQERMLMVLDPAREDAARAVFEKWDLDFAVVGETIGEDRFLITLNGEVKADLPLRALSGEAPEYDRPYQRPAPPAPLGAVPSVDPLRVLERLAGCPDLASRAWVWEQYDSQVGADTIRVPGADAGIVRVHGSRKALAFTADVTPRYCLADPVEGGKQAVAEAYRNLIASGAVPLAVTDNLNFGNPEKPEIMGQFVGCIEGIGAACRALGTPVVSGNVSLYNETDGRAILPTPTIGAVGLLSDVKDIIGAAPSAGDALVRIGPEGAHLGASIFAREIMDDDGGPPPPVDLEAERTAAAVVHAARDGGHLTAAHDIADGGLAVAALEMALAGGVGLTLTETGSAALFGEDQGRYLLATPKPDAVLRLAKDAGLSAAVEGRFGGDSVQIGDGALPLSTLAGVHRSGLSKVLTAARESAPLASA
ncbi:MAG: phosphoribosylformylglycinamidine synthase subunit PurL, partial [Pseudomonadota bacterium]